VIVHHRDRAVEHYRRCSKRRLGLIGLDRRRSLAWLGAILCRCGKTRGEARR